MTTKLEPYEVLFEVKDGTEYATLRAEDFRAAMRQRDFLQAWHGELHRQIDYVRALVWDDISAREILVNLRNMLDRPKI